MSHLSSIFSSRGNVSSGKECKGNGRIRRIFGLFSEYSSKNRIFDDGCTPVGSLSIPESYPGDTISDWHIRGDSQDLSTNVPTSSMILGRDRGRSLVRGVQRSMRRFEGFVLS